MQIDLHSIVYRYGEHPVLQDASLSVAKGELLALLGPSGAGKTTLLFIVAGLKAPASGSVRLGDREATALPPREREIGMVFQDLALWPHLTVAGHLDFVLASRGLPKPERRSRIAEILDVVELTAMAAKVPAMLSGGEAQRLGLARALVTRPQILLLDEPLGALDRRLREKMLLLIRKVHTQYQTTTLYVTHDYDDALGLAERVAVMHAGRVEQVGAPGEVYRQPANARIAGLSGAASILAAERDGDRVRLPWGIFHARFPGPVGSRVSILLRPEQVDIVEGNSAEVIASRFRSGRWETDVQAGSAVVTGCANAQLAPGTQVSLSVAEPLWGFGSDDVITPG